MVNHKKALKQDMLLRAIVYKHTIVDPKQPYASVDFAINTVEYEDDSLSVSITFAADRIPNELARALFDRFQDTLEKILANRHCSASYSIEEVTDLAAKC
jgi:hypothetical protein